MKKKRDIFACLSGPLALLVLTGCPTPPSLSPRSLTFPPQVVNPTGPASAPQAVTLHAGSGSRVVGSITVTGPYSQTNNCPSTLASGTSCAIQVTFAPNAVGNIYGELDASGLSSSLTGAGLPPVGFSPGSLDFGTVGIGGTGAAQSVTLTNNQATALAITAIATSGDYSQANNCPSSLAAGATCTLNVTFQPTGKGTIAGAITVSTDATLAAQPLGLTGIGSGPATPNVSFTPAGLDFGSLEAGTTSSVKAIMLRNTSSTASLNITSIAASAGYASTDTCAGKILPANGTCTISVKFQPVANLVPIPYPGAITVVDGDGTSPQVIGLSGTGVAPVSPSPVAMDFGTMVSNATSAPQTITFTNVDAGSESLTLTSYGPFTIGNNSCGGSLAPAGKCSADVTFGPGGVGPATGVMMADFSSGGFLNPQAVSLTGCRTEVIRTPQSLNFGAVALGKTSDPETVTVSGGTFNFSGITLTGPNSAEFAIADNSCGSTLSSGSCTLDLTFTPTGAGTRTASLEIADDQHCSPQTVSLTGGSSVGPFVLTGVPNGTGSGNLTSNPAGLNCGSQGTDCSANFATGTVVKVSAAPDANSTFAGFGGACSGTGSCNLTMNADRQVTAAFNLDPSLTLNLGGNASGTGTVTSNPPGINCQNPPGGTACQAYFPPGTSVQLTATPGPGSVFGSWSGACSGTGACTLTMNADQSVTATFNGPPTVSVNLSGTGAGSVVSTPAGINCPAGKCSSTFPSGTAVTLAATAGGGSGFDGWNGPCSGTGSCSFNLATDQSVGAVFDLPDFSVTVSPPGVAPIVPGGQATFNIAIAETGGFNQPVTLGCSAPTIQGVNCSLAPPSVMPGGSATLTVTTKGPSAALAPFSGTRDVRPLWAAWISFPMLAALGLGTTGSTRRRRRLVRLVFYGLLLCLVALQIACSSSSNPSNPGTPAGTYTVNINATSGTTLQHPTSVTVTVQ